MDAIFKTIDRLTGYSGELKDYKVISVSEGKDALAKVTTRVSFDDTTPTFVGHGLSIDIYVFANCKCIYWGIKFIFISKNRLTKKLWTSGLKR